MRAGRSASSGRRSFRERTTSDSPAATATTPLLLPKVVFVGDAGVGKTSLISAYSSSSSAHFPEEYVPTVFESHRVHVGKSEEEIEVWDTGGQEEYTAIRHRSYAATQQVDVVVVVFAVDSRDSFENLFGGGSNNKKWLQEAREHCPHAAIVVVGTKAEVREDDGALAEAASYGKPVLDREEYEARVMAASSVGVEAYLECSALVHYQQKKNKDSSSTSGVEEVFREICRAHHNTKHARAQEEQRDRRRSSRHSSFTRAGSSTAANNTQQQDKERRQSFSQRHMSCAVS